MTLHIFTLHWNKLSSIKNLKLSLDGALNSIEYKWLIKDNNSQDKSQEEIESWNDPNVMLFKYPHNNDNYSQGMNFLLKECNPKDNDLILTLNNDITFNDTASIFNMINILNKDKEVGLVGAKLNYPNSLIQHAGVVFNPYTRFPWHFDRKEMETDFHRQNRYFPIVTGAVALTRASIFKELKFNEKFHWCFEDCDFAMRVIHHLNKKVVYCGKTNITHEESATLNINHKNKLFMNHNCATFRTLWMNKIDISLEDSYKKNPKFNLYTK